MPAAVDLMNLPKLEPPAPVASPANADADGPSFQQHLERAEKLASNDAPTPRDERPAEPTNAAPPQPAKPNETNEGRPPEKDAHAENGEKPAVDEGKPQSEHDGDEGEKQDDATDAVTAAAIVQVLAVETDEPVAQEDEVCLTANIDEIPKSDGGKAATKAALAEVVAIAPTKPAAVEANPEDVDTTTVEVVTPQVTDVVERVKPVGEENGAKKKPTETAKPAAAPQIDAAKISVEPTVAQTAAVAEGTKVETSADDDGAKDEAKSESVETTLAAEVAPTTAPSDAAAAAIAATTTSTGDGDTSTKSDKQSKSNDKSDGPVSDVDGNSDKTRTDRAPNAEPQRPTTHREAAATRADGGESTRTLSHADRARLVQRVARAVQTAQERGGDLKIRLSPPELGSLRLQVRLTDGALSARIEADTPAARQLLVDNLPQLRERLAEQNIRVEKFDVDLFNSGGGGASQMPQQPFTREDAASAATIRRATSRGAAAAESGGAKTSTTTLGDGGLNVVV